MDTKDVENPIKYYYDDKLFWYFDTHIEQTTFIYLQFNDADLVNDRYIGETTKEEIVQSFTQINSIRSINPSNGLMMILEFRLENIKQTYTRLYGN